MTEKIGNQTKRFKPTIIGARIKHRIKDISYIKNGDK